MTCLIKNATGFPSGARGIEPTHQCRRGNGCNFIHQLGRSPGVGNGNPLQYSCLENPKHRGAYQATSKRSQSRTRLKQFSTV